jgi:hypothetical protein
VRGPSCGPGAYEAARDDEESGLGRDINLSDLFEEILIDPLEHELLCVLGTDVVVHQQIRKRWSVDQDDSGG